MVPGVLCCASPFKPGRPQPMQSTSSATPGFCIPFPLGSKESIVYFPAANCWQLCFAGFMKWSRSLSTASLLHFGQIFRAFAQGHGSSRHNGNRRIRILAILSRGMRQTRGRVGCISISVKSPLELLAFATLHPSNVLHLEIHSFTSCHSFSLVSFVQFSSLFTTPFFSSHHAIH